MKKKNIDIIIISLLLLISLIFNIYVIVKYNSRDDEYDIAKSKLIFYERSANSKYSIKIYWEEDIIPLSELFVGGKAYYGAQPIKVKILKNGKLINYISTDVRNYLEGLNNENCEVIWNEDYVKLRLTGKDQSDKIYVFPL